MNHRTTVHEKERWFLDQPSRWCDFRKLTDTAQKELLHLFFQEMRSAGYYSTRTSTVDGRVGVRKIIEGLLDQGRGDGTL